MSEEEREHTESEECWCNPECIFIADNGAEVWIHKAPADELPPPYIIAEAIADAIAGR